MPPRKVRHCGKADDPNHKSHPFTSTEDGVKCQCPGGVYKYKNIVPGGPKKKPLKKEPKYKFQQKRRKPSTHTEDAPKCRNTSPHPAHTFGYGSRCPGVPPKK